MKHRMAEPSEQYQKRVREHVGRQVPASSPCSLHSRMAPASCNTEMAHPCSVRIAGRLSFVLLIETAPAQTNPSRPWPFRAVSTGQGFEIVRAKASPCSFGVFGRRQHGPQRRVKLGTPYATNCCRRNKKGISMLLLYLPAIVADAMLEVYLAGLSAWGLTGSDPIVVVMVDDAYRLRDGSAKEAT